MRCWNCGGNINRDMQYCEWCGAELEKTQSYSQSEFDQTMEKEKSILHERPNKERINLQYSRNEETKRKGKKPVIQSHGPILHKKTIIKPKYDFILLLSSLIGILYSIFILFTNSNIIGDGFHNNPMLSHIIGVLLAVIINGFGFYYKQEGLILAGAILFTVTSLIYLSGAPILFISAALGYLGYDRQYCINHKIKRKKSADSK